METEILEVTAGICRAGTVLRKCMGTYCIWSQIYDKIQPRKNYLIHKITKEQLEIRVITQAVYAQLQSAPLARRFSRQSCPRTWEMLRLCDISSVPLLVLEYLQSCGPSQPNNDQNREYGSVARISDAPTAELHSLITSRCQEAGSR